ncbi:MAG: pilus assembly protein PilM [Planctomycetota bacterium]
MGFINKKLLAIDWDAKSLRLVLTRPRVDGVDLLKAVSIPVPSDVRMDDAESLGAFVREAIRQSRVSAKRVLMSIPRDQVVLNTLSLPPTPEGELPAIVQFQIVKELPFSPDQATVDFAVGGKFDASEPVTVLVAAVRNEELSFYRRVAHEAGLTVERIGLRPYSNLVAVTSKSQELAGKTLLLIEVGPQLTEIDIIRDGRLVFSRAASVALSEYGSLSEDRLDDSRIISMPLKDREPDERMRRAVKDLMVDIIRSYEAHRATDPSISIDRIVVCGASGIEAQLAESLAARFAAHADLYSPDRTLDLSPQRAKELRGFSATLGLALGHSLTGLPTFDFLHPKKPVSKRTVQLKKLPLAVAAVVLFVGAGVTTYARVVRPKKLDVAAMEQALGPLRDKEKTILGFKEQVESLENWQRSEQYWPEVLVALTEVMPPDKAAFATRLDLETRTRQKGLYRRSRADIRLRTATLGKVNELSAKLRELGFESVKTGKETPLGRTRGAGIYAYDTSIEAELPLRPKRSRSKEQEGHELVEVPEPPDELDHAEGHEAVSEERGAGSEEVLSTEATDMRVEASDEATAPETASVPTGETDETGGDDATGEPASGEVEPEPPVDEPSEATEPPTTGKGDES